MSWQIKTKCLPLFDAIYNRLNEPPCKNIHTKLGFITKKTNENLNCRG